MSEEEKDVIVESSTTEEAVPETQEVQETPEVQETQVTDEAEVPSTQDVKPEVIKDDRPIENVTWEVKRKLDEVVPTLQKEIAELKSHLQSTQQPAKPQYTKAQLRAYAADPETTTEQRLWAYTEVDNIEKAERQREYENLVKTTQERGVSETKRSQSAKWVAETFPDTIIKDNSGRFAGWNANSPVLQRANEYISRSEALRNDPEGFSAAVKLAAFDLGVAASKNLTKKMDRTVGQLRKEQKKQLASAGGSRPTENPEATSKIRLEKLQEEYARTGKREIFAEIIKQKKMNPFV